ncbi:MBL fold metallo-hydrolase [Oscillospiraceae bacterium OttesenSCG-928-F05]|nr:MBL fold metallo-hydrolase [Oscillospiraceae bacterium OttesenSCG-928-F05]
MAFMCTLASGSSGNVTLLSTGRHHILIDAGLSTKRIREALRPFDIALEDLSGLLITHEHSDHVKGLPVLSRQISAPIYMTHATARELLPRMPELELRIETFTGGEDFEIGDIGVHSFDTSHDTPGSVGYYLTVGQTRIGYATDLGYVPGDMRRLLSQTDALFIESNHDLMRLLGGPYPERLKRRILSPHGHLENGDCADTVGDAVQGGARYVTLCHLSDENNTPELAFDASAAALGALSAIVGKDVALQTAPPAGASALFEF